jgi:SAM-dependent methyltransferase
LAFDRSAEVYDALYGDKDYTAELSYVLGIAGLAPSTHPVVLELGCGSGRYSKTLAESGFDVIGVDMSRPMIAHARASHANLPRDAASRLRYEIGDARTFRLHAKVSCVLALFHVVNYMVTDDDVRQFFATAAEHLASGGLLALDYWHDAGVLADPPTPRTREVDDGVRRITRRATPHHDSDTHVVRVHYDIDIVERDRVTTFEEVHVMRYFGSEEIARIAQPWFDRVRSMGWMTSRTPDARDWTALAVLRRR